jgi:hypothetical protein
MLKAFVNCAKIVLPALAMGYGAVVLTKRLHFFIPIAKGRSKEHCTLVN